MFIIFIVFVFSFIAFSISAICGGGAGLMLIPLLSRVLPVSQMPAALSIGTFTSSVSRLVVFKKDICWKIVRYFVPAAIPAVWLGAWLLKFINPVYLEIGMGLFLISNLTFLFKKPKEISASHHPSTFTLMIIGFFAGFLSGLTGAVGVLFNRFYLRYGLTKEGIIATRAANEVILHLFKIVLYFLFGLISIKVLSIGVTVAVSAVLSTWFMKWVLPRMSEFFFKKIGYFAMVLSGFIMLSQSFSDVFSTNHASIGSNIKEKGFETKLKWQQANYALEFTYDEGFEFEQVIPMQELTIAQQNKVSSQRQNGQKVVIEAVYAIHETTSYEAYYFENDKLIRKMDFK